MRKTLVALFIMLALAVAHAARVLLTWDPDPEPDIAGYRIYYGTNSRVYQVIVDVGNVTNTIVSGLERGLTWYFAATAYNTSSLESDLSEEVSLYLPDHPAAPENVQVFLGLEGSTNVVGPWTNIVGFPPVLIDTNGGGGGVFIRARVDIEHAPTTNELLR